MAWRNIDLEITFPAIARCNITDFSLLSLTSWPEDWSSYVSTPTAVQSDFNVTAGTGIWTTVMGSDSWRIDGNTTTSGSATIHIYMQGYNNYLGYGNEFISSGRTWGYVAAVDDETHMGFIAFLSKRTDRTNFSKWSGTVPPYPASTAPQSQTLIRSLMYTLLTGNESHNHKSNGGGATHIAKVTGQLNSLSSNLSDILIVSGGGGGGLLVGDTAYAGKDAGGISGSGDNSANQSTGYGFGQGESNSNASGGGSGLYGGYKGTNTKGGGAGSGYIGNSLVSNKKMVGYNVPTSDAEGTKTESVQVYSAAPFANKPKMGDGFARIKFLREYGPDPEDYQDYLDIINGKAFAEKWYLCDNWFASMTSAIRPGESIPGIAYHTALISPNQVSYKDSSTDISLNYWNTATVQSHCISYYSSRYQRYYIGDCRTYDIVDIYINYSNGQYVCTTSTLNNVAFTRDTQGEGWLEYGVLAIYRRDRDEFVNYISYNTAADNTPWTFQSESLEDCFKMIAMVWRNVNIYVEGVLWSSVNNTN